jgi:hypothetical protein
MALKNAARNVAHFIATAYSQGYAKYRDIYSVSQQQCAYGAAQWVYYYFGWRSYSAQSTYIGEDANGFRYYHLVGTTIEGYYETGQEICRDGPTDNYYPGLGGFGNQQFTATLAQDGTTETRPYDGAKYLTYTGYPVIATISINGDDYLVNSGIASELTVAACAAACALNNKTVDIQINIS